MLTLNPFQIFFTKQYGIKSDISLLCEVEGDHLCEANEIPDNKVELLKKYCAKNGIDLIRCAHVGDSQNDIETFRNVGFSIALNTSDAPVGREASVSLRTNDFIDVANTIINANDLA